MACLRPGGWAGGQAGERAGGLAVFSKESWAAATLPSVYGTLGSEICPPSTATVRYAGTRLTWVLHHSGAVRVCLLGHRLAGRPTN